MASSTIYARKPLELGSRNIRLIETVKNDGKSTLKYLLHVFPLSSCPEYAALSYWWGPKEYRKIVLEAEQFTIGRNLSEFLDSRQTDAQTFLWIDAICIDQGNTPECNDQVAMMRDIYRMVSSLTFANFSTRYLPRQGFNIKISRRRTGH